MLIEKGKYVVVSHERKGTFPGVATKTFDTDIEEWYPIATAKQISGLIQIWEAGEEVPCRARLCKVEPVESFPKGLV